MQTQIILEASAGPEKGAQMQRCIQVVAAELTVHMPRYCDNSIATGCPPECEKVTCRQKKLMDF